MDFLKFVRLRWGPYHVNLLNYVMQHIYVRDDLEMLLEWFWDKFRDVFGTVLGCLVDVVGKILR